jgi:hypothetical protein
VRVEKYTAYSLVPSLLKRSAEEILLLLLLKRSAKEVLLLLK